MGLDEAVRQFGQLLQHLGIDWWLVRIVIGIPVVAMIVAFVAPRLFGRPVLAWWLAAACLLQVLGTLYFVDQPVNPWVPASKMVERMGYFLVASSAVCWFLAVWLVLAPRPARPGPSMPQTGDQPP